MKWMGKHTGSPPIEEVTMKRYNLILLVLLTVLPGGHTARAATSQLIRFDLPVPAGRYLNVAGINEEGIVVGYYGPITNEYRKGFPVE
jgi:hypothetical protein